MPSILFFSFLMVYTTPAAATPSIAIIANIRNGQAAHQSVGLYQSRNDAQRCADQ